MLDRSRDTDKLEETYVPNKLRSDLPAALSAKLLGRLRTLRDQSPPPKPRVEDVLQAEGLRAETLDLDVLTDLVYAEWTLRTEQGETLVQGEYRQRFPMISEQLERQWFLEQGLAELSQDPTWNRPTQPPTDSGCAEQLEFDFIGKYKVVSRLGAGGQAEVFRAVHPELLRDVVIKVLRPAWRVDTSLIRDPADPALVSRVFEEGRLLARLSHPHVAQVYDIGQHVGFPFLVMEFVPGLSLDQYQRTHSLSWPEVARLLAQVTRAVSAAHAQGIVHRDIKPQNIVVRDDGQPKLIDFGLAQMCDAWHPQELLPGISGTLGYMAPEQASGVAADVGPHSDIFSLGAVLYFLLTGQPPYQGSPSRTGVNLLAILERAKRCEWDRKILDAPGMPAPLVAICVRAMAAQPAARFATAFEFAEALDKFAAGSKSRVWTIAIAATVLLIVSIVTASVSQFSKKYNLNSVKAESNPVRSSPQAVRADLRIRVRREMNTLDLTDAVPLSDGEEIRIEARISAGVSLMLFAISGDGKLQHVISVPSQTEDRSWRYPEDLAETVPLTGPAGTECLLVIGSAEPTPSVDQIQTAWGVDVEWPSLPASTVLRLIGSKTTIEQLSRDLGTPKATRLTPTDHVSKTLERFAHQLKPQCQLLEGLAFSHIMAAE